MHVALFFLYSGSVLAHPGHGQSDLLHRHGEWLLLVVAIAAVICWQILRKP